MNKQNSSQPKLHRGFTLLELLVVIVIISVLMSLILPALSSVRRRAAVVAVQTEMKQIEQALTMFESRFGSLPPSNLTIPISGNPGAWGAASRSAVRSMWPQFDFASNGGLGNTTAIHLNGAECLVFFLGGVQSGDEEAPVLSGFSKNASQPWVASQSPEGPFMEFDLSRISDVDEDGPYEYRSEIDPVVPLLYLSSRGKRYNATNDTSSFPNDDYDVFSDDPARNMSSCYLNADGTTPQRPDSFQLIHAGEDGRYGTGGVFPSPDEFSNRREERDNITNFSDGTFQ